MAAQSATRRRGWTVTLAAMVLSAMVACAAPPREPVPDLQRDLDRLELRVKALAERDPDPALCDSACLAGVQSVTLRRGLVSCRCRRVQSLGVYRLAKGGP